MVVIHYTGMESAAAALARLCDPGPEVSAHYLIGGDGRLWHLVDEDLRAWHAGQGSWGGVTDVNSRSIGIELDNRGDHPFAEPQMAVLERLLPAVMARWSIPPERVIGHQDMAPARKQDPGRRFDWRRLARAGLSVWPEAAEGAEADFAAAAARFGYPPEAPGLVLDAFRARFRPEARGPLDATDRRMMAALAARWPAEPGIDAGPAMA